MNLSDVTRELPPKFAVVLSGCRATFTNEFRRKSHRLEDLLTSLGFWSGAASVSGLLVLGRLLMLFVIGVGILWTPHRAGLTSLGIPLTTPATVSIVAVLLAVALLQARRRYTRANPRWSTASIPLETGMRMGIVLMDLGLAAMLILQNLRWQEVTNWIAAGTLFVSCLSVISPVKSAAVKILVAVGVGASAVGVLMHQVGAGWLVGSGSSAQVLHVDAALVIAGFVFTASLTPPLYRLVSPGYSQQSRRLHADLAIKSGGIFVFSSGAIFVMEMTPWPQTAPLIMLSVFFLGLVLYRSSFARIFSPEMLGYALLLVRLKPSWVRPIILRGLLISIVTVTPLTLASCVLLIHHQHTRVAILLVALVILEMSIDALIIQRRTAVLGSSRISQLAQESKAGMGAALGTGFTVVFSGILGTTTPSMAESHWLGITSGALALVALLLVSLVLHDAPTWLRELSATETEDA